MPHVAIYQRPQRNPVHRYTVTVKSAEGRSQFTVPAHNPNEAKRDALRLYAQERDTPVTAWAEVH